MPRKPAEPKEPNEPKIIPLDLTDVPAAEFAAWLKNNGACGDSYALTTGKSLRESWDACDNPQYLLWLLGKYLVNGEQGVTQPLLVNLACDCAEKALKYVEHGEDWPALAIKAARRWASDPSEENRAAALAAADAAYAAAYAARAARATYAARAAYAAAYAARAARATYAARAAYAAAYAARAARAARAAYAARAACAAYAAYAACAAYAARAAYVARAAADAAARAEQIALIRLRVKVK